MAGRRIERLNEQLRRELTELLHRHVKDPRIGTVTVTAVETSPDLTFARVHVHGADPSARAAQLEGLAAASAFLRGELGRRLRIRRVPALGWQWDPSLEYASRIDALLAEVRARDDEAGPGPEADARDRDD
jgi:ribosome-binding factor A